MMERCPDCGVMPGDQHLNGCDVERCPDCGGQLISCGCPINMKSVVVWSGLWPGVMECREFGWYAKMVPGQGWIRCDDNDPQAHEDLNRLYIEAVWDKNLKRFILED